MCKVDHINEESQVTDHINEKNPYQEMLQKKVLPMNLKVNISYFNIGNWIINITFSSLEFIGIIYSFHSTCADQNKEGDEEGEPNEDENNGAPAGDENQDDTMNYEMEDYNRNSGEETDVINQPSPPKTRS